MPLPAQQSAGKVDRLIPAGFIARGANTAEAKPADPVQWNDILRTNDAGRMRVGLDDGSVLSIGAHSELRIVKHDTESNQTLIEMLYGKARANVTPIRKTGGSFQVRTPTAVVGVLGTTVEVESAPVSSTITGQVIEQMPTQNRNLSDLAQLTPGLMPNGDSQQPPTIADYPSDTTIVRSLDHMVGVKNIDPRIPQIVFLLPGQYTIVRRGQPPTPPQFGEPPQPQTPQPPAYKMANGQPCPTFVDPRQFDKLFPAGSQPSYEINGRGTSTGQAFDVHIKNPSGCPLNVQIPAGSVLKPTGYTERVIKGILLNSGMPPLKDYQVMMAEGGFGEIPTPTMKTSPGMFFFLPPEEEETDFVLRGYCLELHKLAPHQKTRYKFADADEQERLSAPNLKVMEAATKMFFSGQGPPPNLAGLDSLAQWSLWASREGLTDPKKFSEEYVGLVKRNYEAQNKKFDKKTKEQVENVAQQFWPFVEKVLQAAK
ncbi:MAG TPA: FecR family protein [Terriglobales bacterium]|nr:FecR family protein [Terriglobales bacterium]